jgi:hypothetical protein
MEPALLKLRRFDVWQANGQPLMRLEVSGMMKQMVFQKRLRRKDLSKLRPANLLITNRPISDGRLSTTTFYSDFCEDTFAYEDAIFPTKALLGPDGWFCPSDSFIWWLKVEVTLCFGAYQPSSAVIVSVEPNFQEPGIIST